MTSRWDRDFGAGWRDIDAAGDSARFAEYLDAATAILRERKLGLLEALQLGAGDSAIDVGCGVRAGYDRLRRLLSKWLR